MECRLKKKTKQKEKTAVLRAARMDARDFSSSLEGAPCLEKAIGRENQSRREGALSLHSHLEESARRMQDYFGNYSRFPLSADVERVTLRSRTVIPMVFEALLSSVRQCPEAGLTMVYYCFFGKQR